MGRLGITPHSYFLATVHRAENTDDPERLLGIMGALGDISTGARPTVLPVHPRTRARLDELGLSVPPAVRLVPPVSYLEMVCLEKNAAAILTDSGGVQKEAYFYRVPCITLRDETEWVETVDAKWNTLAGADRATIAAAVAAAPGTDGRLAWKPIYGDGTASDAVVAELLAARPGEGHGGARR